MNINFKKIIDLTLPIRNGMSTYPGEKISCKPVMFIPRDKHNVLNLNFFTHTGTHLDAPFHVFEKGATVDKYPLNTFIAKSLKIDLRLYKSELSKNGSFAYLKVIEKRHLLKYHKEIAKSDALILHTGYGEILKLGEKFIDFEFPHLTKECAEYIAGFKKLKLLGIDSLTIDKKGNTASHYTLLRKSNFMILETLINLEKAPNKFILICFPLNIKNSDGAPCRAVALV